MIHDNIELHHTAELEGSARGMMAGLTGSDKLDPAEYLMIRYFSVKYFYT
jgi:hypothetical protein